MLVFYNIMDTIIVFLKKNTKLHLFYLALLLFTTLYYLMQWPIFAGDTDLWYHLNGGRYIIENRSLPGDSFFSFISPPREWVDYYWLFQIFVYAIHLFSGYYGLIILKTIVFSVIIWMVLLSLYNKIQDDDQSYLYISIIFSLYLLFLIPRYQLIRPHIFTYLFIATFIHILEFKKEKAVFLPLLAVVWCNIHGIEYPVMILILLAYVSEFFTTHFWHKKHIKKDELSYIGPIIISMFAVYLTPHCSNLTWVPFIPTRYASLYIQELKYFAFDDLASFFIVKMSVSLDTAFNLLFIAACLSMIMSVIKKKLRVSHVILFIGGIMLLTRGKRFGYEFVLLAIPVIKANAFNLSVKGIQNKVNRFMCVIVIACMAIIPFISLKNMFTNPPRHPVSYKNIPHGIALFLNHINVGGYVFNHPDNGGYLQWMLRPKYKIFMDMEVPFLFTDEDVYLAGNAFFNDILLERLISEYNPSFIVVPIANVKFKEMIKSFKDYKIVFFDDSAVLYINRSHYSSVADEYTLKAIDPFMLINQSINSLESKEGIKQAIKELHKILQIYPDCGITNQIMAMIYNNEGLYRKAIPYEDAVIKNYPELPVGYKLKADSLKGFDEYDKTIENYRIALKKSDVNSKSDIIYMNKEIALINLKQKYYKRAYKLFEKTINIFSPDTSYRDIYYLSLSASMAGKTKEAFGIYKYGYISVPADNKEWQDKYKDLRVIIGNVNED